MRRLIFTGMVTLGGALGLTWMLAGTSAAQADELPLQHQPDKALQQKLDLLDHGSDAPDAALNPDVTDGSFPRSVRIPGTNTSIRIYGSGTETLEYSR